MSTQMYLWPAIEEDIAYNEMKNLRNDVTQLRKSMFARHGEFMKVMADLQGQINELNKEKNMEERQADPELAKFFENLVELKRYIKSKLLNSSDPELVDELGIIYDRLHRIFLTKEEADVLKNNEKIGE